eukprot:CAMPEP_0182820224 /NCGR_PEP_ID=MMETSP0006_2-20121128/13015_1 /TAXON_ID=97485 /ORGANISM="Prymnesium parvum, Strain Texoma1" /LENGTH=60 /DNA_ID=CAMNT_0024946885 /DNA_START=57 /DNA_END=236 /DNA_ORIENTATION=+
MTTAPHSSRPDSGEMISAASNGDVRALTQLLENNADIAAREEDGSSALHWAARNGHEGVV